LRALFSRHFPQPVLSTVVAPSGGVQQTATQNEGTATALQTRPRREPLFLNCQGSARVTPTEAPILCFLALVPDRHAFVSGAFKALWDANSTPVCWGCQEGIPIYCISVLASGMLPPLSPFCTRRFSSSKIQVAHCSHATPDLPLFEFSVACQVAVQHFRPAHASISARAEVRRFRSEREKFRLSSRGHFSTAGPMAT
jgi:hypothetical protein